MALSTNTMRGLNRYLPGARHKDGVAVSRLVVWNPTTAPVYGSHVRPTSAPSGTALKGDSYFGTDGVLYTHDGTAFRPQVMGGSAVAQSIGGALAVSGVITGPRQTKNAATVLTAADSGALCVWSTAAGYLYTLPTAAAGLWFDFLVATTITSVGAKVLTASASEFILGSFLQIPDAAAQIVARNADGSTIRSWNGNGTTTGGYAGDSFRLTAISATQWVISGIGLATGTEATAFATS
jgi:hypothetical protein